MRKLSELQISPTPWKVGDAMPYHEEHVVYTQNHRYDDGSRHDKVIATCNHYFRERIADARLIAAAPELYDMLQSLVEYIDRECIPCGETACELLAAAHNVLSKAAGEEVGDGK